jgi:voltage-gated potassium channel
MTHGWRSQVAKLFEAADDGSMARIAVKIVLIAAIVASVAVVVLETVESVADRYRVLFIAIEIIAVGVFSVEYALRLWTAPEGNLAHGVTTLRSRLEYVTSAFGVIDLLAILPFYVNVLLPIHPDALHLLRLLRVLKLARDAPGLSLFVAVLRNERRPLLISLMVMLVLLVLESSVMFILERNAQPMAFGSIPHAMWWTIVTMSTIGYGDVIPMTILGRIFGGFVMVIGIAMFAVPAGILATGFAVEIRKRDFVVTWQTVAKVPLFAGLDAARIAEIARLLKRQVVPANYAVVRRGEPADAMFFIMAGELEVDVQPHPRRLGRGQYFGEIGLLYDTVRTATVTTVSECDLLALQVMDFRRLLDTYPDLRGAVAKVAEQRLSAGASGPSEAPPR